MGNDMLNCKGDGGRQIGRSSTDKFVSKLVEGTLLFVFTFCLLSRSHFQGHFLVGALEIVNL